MITRTISNLSPWLAPLPTAYAVAMAVHTGLAWPLWVALVAAVIIETTALATSATALELWSHNRSKRKSDPASPAWLAWTLTAGVIAAQSALVLALHASPVLLIFQAFSAAAVINLALRADHAARLAGIEADRAERKAERAERQADKSAPAPVQSAQPAQPAAQPEQARGTYEAFAIAQRMRNGQGPMKPDAVQSVYGVSRTTAYEWLRRYQTEREVING